MNTFFQARFIQESYRVGDEYEETHDMRNFEDIIEYGQNNNMTYCELSKGHLIEMQGTTFKSDLVREGRIYFNVRDIRTRDDLLKSADSDFPDDLKTLFKRLFNEEPRLKALFDRELREDKKELQKESTNTVFVTTSAGRHEILQTHDIAYDPNGNKVWPHQPATKCANTNVTEKTDMHSNIRKHVKRLKK